MNSQHSSITLLKFLFFLLVFTNVNYVFARHLVGGEMTYTCTSPGNYSINLTLYRDCAAGGANFDSNGATSQIGTVTVYSETQVFIRTINLPSPTVSDIDVEYNPCHLLGMNNCLEKGVYNFDISLPLSPETYTIVYQRCCRGNNLTNIINGDVTGMTCYVQINSAAQNLCSDSPVFVNFATINLCLNQDLFYDHHATSHLLETELKYSLCPALAGGGIAGINGNPMEAQGPNGVAPNPDLPPPYNVVAYFFPTYNYNKPLIANPQLAIHPTTGQISGYPTATGSYVIAVCVQEFRNDTLMSEIRRELHYNVINCEAQSYTVIDSAFAIGTNINGVIINQDTTFTFVYQNPTDGCDSFVTYVVDAISSVTIKQIINEVEVYPNPFVEEFHIKFFDSDFDRIKIFNGNGQLVFERSNIHSDFETISTDGWSSGLYFIELNGIRGSHLSQLLKL